MYKVAIITEKQKELIDGEVYKDEMTFNPILDGNGNWVISEQEVRQNENKNYKFINELKLIDFEPQKDDFLI